MKTYLNTINGQQVGSDKTFESLNPATGESLGSVPISTKQQVADAIAAARAAQPAWAAKPDAERKALMMKVAEVIKANAPYLADWVTREQGKPLGGVGPDQVPGARFELWGCEVWTQVPASLDLPVELAFEDETRRDEVHRKPFGVVAAIAPWNWPLLIAIWQIIPSIRAGNTVVIKPSEYTSIGTLELVRLIAEVLPKGVVNTISGSGEVGSWLVSDPGIDKVMFTGSGPTGAKIAEAAAKNLVPVTLELGGNDAAIVLADNDPKEAAPKIFQGAFQNSGQVCIAIKRAYVHESIYDEMCDELAKLAKAAVVGDGLQQGVNLGPLQNKTQFEKVLGYIESAKADGKIIAGGARATEKGYFIQPTIVRDITDGAKLVDEEQFGPVLPVIKIKDGMDAVARANNSEYGLGGSVWSKDLDKAWELASQMNTGTVWINKHADLAPNIPFGGAKLSGVGTELGEEGLSEFTQMHVINMAKA